MAKYTCDTLKNKRPHNPYHILRDSNWHLYYNSKYFRGTQARLYVIMQSLLHHCRAVNMSYSSWQDIITCKVISAGRTFLCRLIDISYSLSYLHHDIRLTTRGSPGHLLVVAILATVARMVHAASYKLTGQLHQ